MHRDETRALWQVLRFGEGSARLWLCCFRSSAPHAARMTDVEMEVKVPQNVEPGTNFLMAMPDGSMVTVTCPPNATAGQTIKVQVPAAVAKAAAPPPSSAAPPPSQRSRFGLFSFRSHAKAASHAVRDAAAPAGAVDPALVEEEDGLHMPEAHPLSANKLQQQEQEQAGEEVISKSGPPPRVRNAVSGDDGDRKSRAGRASRRSFDDGEAVPSYLSTCATRPPTADLSHALRRALECAQTAAALRRAEPHARLTCGILCVCVCCDVLRVSADLVLRSATSAPASLRARATFWRHC